MDVVRVLKQEEAELTKRLKAVRSAIAALNGNHRSGPLQSQKPRQLSASGRARIRQAAKARWKKFRAAQAKAVAKK